MGFFILRRIGQTLVVLAIASIIVFTLMRLIPGDPIQILMGSEYAREAAAELRRQLGLDRPIVVQYLVWVGNVLLWQAFLPSLCLVIGTTIIGLLIALPSGIIAAVKKDTVWDYGSMGFAIMAYSMPSFWKGIILIWVFGVYLGWFPIMGYVHP